MCSSLASIQATLAGEAVVSDFAQRSNDVRGSLKVLLSKKNGYEEGPQAWVPNKQTHKIAGHLTTSCNYHSVLQKTSTKVDYEGRVHTTQNAILAVTPIPPACPHPSPLVSDTVPFGKMGASNINCPCGMLAANFRRPTGTSNWVSRQSLLASCCFVVAELGAAADCSGRVVFGLAQERR